MRAKPNLQLVGPRLGKGLARDPRGLSPPGVSSSSTTAACRRIGHALAAQEVFVERTAPEGWALAEDDGLVVTSTGGSTPELELEGRVYDLIHAIQRLRKEAGLEISDRIVLTLPGDGVDKHADWIKAETLAVEIENGPELAVRKA